MAGHLQSQLSEGRPHECFDVACKRPVCGLLWLRWEPAVTLWIIPAL